MKIASNIKSKPALPLLLKKSPIFFMLFHGTAQGIYPFIFVPREVYDSLNSSKPNPYHVALIRHEQTHLDRQRDHGWLKWMLKYALIAQFRFKEEIIADKAMFVFLKEKNMEYDFERRARMLSGWLYLKPVSYDVALKELKATWAGLG